MGIKAIEIKNKKGFQAIQIPEQLKIEDDRVFIKKVGNTLHIIPFHNPWQNLLEAVDAFTLDFMENREEPGNQKRESID